AHDLFHRELKLRIADLAHDTIDNRIRVPRAEQNANVAFGRQRAPVAPHAWPLALLVGHLTEGMSKDVPRIHPFVEDIDGFTFACAIDAADDDNDRKALVLEQVVLRLKQ